MLQNQGWIGLRSQGKMSVLEAIEVRRQHENLQGKQWWNPKGHGDDDDS
jgi:hypothetical protein